MSAGQPFANRFSRFRRRDSSGRGEVCGKPPSGADGHVQPAGERRKSSSLISRNARGSTKFLHRFLAGRASRTVGHLQRGPARIPSAVHWDSQGIDGNASGKVCLWSYVAVRNWRLLQTHVTYFFRSARNWKNISDIFRSFLKIKFTTLLVNYDYRLKKIFFSTYHTNLLYFFCKWTNKSLRKTEPRSGGKLSRSSNSSLCV